MDRSAILMVLAVLVAATACGGGGRSEAPGEPLLSGSLAGVYRGEPFTPTFGFSGPYQGATLIGLGDGPLNCGSPMQAVPPSGTNAIFSIPALALGSYSSVLVQIMQFNGIFHGTGSTTGTLTITSVTTTAVAGSFEYSYMDAGQTYGLSGTFEVMRCPN